MDNVLFILGACVSYHVLSLVRRDDLSRYGVSAVRHLLLNLGHGFS